MKPTFLTLGDQTVNVAHVLIVREVARAAAPIGRDVSIDMGKMGTVPWLWTPRDEGELGWFYRAIGRRRPGEEPEAKSEDRNPKTDPLRQSDSAARGNPNTEIRGPKEGETAGNSQGPIADSQAPGARPTEPVEPMHALPVRGRRK